MYDETRVAKVLTGPRHTGPTLAGWQPASSDGGRHTYLRTCPVGAASNNILESHASY